ncbi:hypothetical protein NBRC116188_17120 [Oceaniserpentilla sp. 4NH20-0058]|uniref:flagellin N-terminal helical domain-containing protein n=1 Tax=Oceaniserpentilla sp. 4NH20-0058 TaxID=3127660 RepID=UPI003101E663
MPQIINTNIASLNAQRNLNKSQSANQTALQRLSSGLRINSAKDDAAGLAISTRFNSQIRGLNVAVRNAGDGISLAQTAEGALGTMNDNLQRIRELAVQSANATNSDVDRDALQSEVSQLLAEVSRTAEETDFNGRKLLDGSFSATFQIGANAGQTVDVSIAELTSEKLGAAASAGLSATGNSNALANGDLTINGIAIDASKAGDDTSSTDNAAASAISKVEAINAKYDQTGVKANVNTNVVSGAEMTGAATSGTLTLNGVDISLSTTVSSVQTRAGITEAINAVSEQTGVMAINSETDAGGIQLIAEDGRNISLSADSTLTAASTGLGLDATTPATQVTYEGGYTLVADADVAEIVIQGGNGTGNGDLANAGLVAGTYAKGEAASVSEVQSSTLTAATIANDGTLANTFADVGDTATVITTGSLGAGGAISVASDAAATELTNAHHFVVNDGSGSQFVAVASDTSLASAASLIDAASGVAAFERIEFTINEWTTTTGNTNALYLGSATISLPNDADAAYDTTTERLQYLTDQLNTTAFAAGLTVTAELNQATDAISVRVDNQRDTQVKVGVATGAGITMSAGGALTVNVDSATNNGDRTLTGRIAYQVSDAGGPAITVSGDESGAATGQLFAGTSYADTVTGNTALSSTGTNQVNVTVGDTALSGITVNANSTVNDLASAINTAYTGNNVNAWEDITLAFDANNLEVGDTLFIGTSGNATGGVGVSVTDPDADGSVSMSELADAFNGTDFSSEDIDVSATIDASGNMVLNIRNHSGNNLGMVSDAEGRSLQEDVSGNLIGAVEQQLSGKLAFSSSDGESVSMTLADPTVGGEFYAGNDETPAYAGVNGLDNGDILINGVSIGAADTNADKASAEFASDGTKILSSSKESSGIAIASAINQVSDETGVSATVNATQVVGGDGTNVDTASFAVGDSAEIYINGYVAGTVTLQDDGAGSIDTDRAKADALSVINSVAGKTGVEGIDNGVSLTLTAEDGRNISIGVNDESGSNVSIGAIFGLDAAVDGIGESTFGEAQAGTNRGISAESATYETTYSTVTLQSAGEFTLAAGSEGADELAALGLAEGSYGGAVQGQFLTDIDISTFEGATAALTSIDNALQSIAAQRADLGAIQNRMESTVSNLAITSENLAAANSRIQDADFAAETAELSRTQVLQQAGISILAQANQGPQQVLSLLG